MAAATLAVRVGNIDAIPDIAIYVGDKISVVQQKEFLMKYVIDLIIIGKLLIVKSTFAPISCVLIMFSTNLALTMGVPTVSLEG